MEGMVNPDPVFWRGRKVFLTGHTGFKGSWMAIWLQALGSDVLGYALKPTTNPSLFEQAEVWKNMKSRIADVRNHSELETAISEFAPEIVFHLAAQPLVRDSYVIPRETYETNVMGTVNVLEAVRHCSSVRSVVVVTTDKCYENREWHWGYREIDRLGGYDPYSSSKAAAELVVSAYRSSFFNIKEYGKSHHLALASARAGNVIGGGDWAKDRLIPDLIRAAQNGTTVKIRHPHAVRPWQHVLEPIAGYLLLAEKIYTSSDYSEAWNFGPRDSDCKTVREIVDYTASALGGISVRYAESEDMHEAAFLRLDISKTLSRLKWVPRWDINVALRKTIELYNVLRSTKTAIPFLHTQLRDYINHVNK